MLRPMLWRELSVCNREISLCGAELEDGYANCNGLNLQYGQLG